MTLSTVTRQGLDAALADITTAREVKAILSAHSAKPASVSFTVGAEAADAILVTLQVKDENSVNVAARTALRVSLISSNTTFAINTAAYTVAAGASGIVSQIVSVKHYEVFTNAAGQAIISLTIAGAGTTYVQAVLPNGDINISGVVTHAA